MGGEVGGGGNKHRMLKVNGLEKEKKRVSRWKIIFELKLSVGLCVCVRIHVFICMCMHICFCVLVADHLLSERKPTGAFLPQRMWD